MLDDGTDVCGKRDAQEKEALLTAQKGTAQKAVENITDECALIAQGGDNIGDCDNGAWLKDGDLVAERKSINVKIAREKKELEINNN